MDYNSDHNSSNHNNDPAADGGLDMDIMHDFGEGVGVDMRDFGVHTGDDDDAQVLHDGMQMQKDASQIDHLNATPVTPHPGSSVTPNGDAPSSAGMNMDNMFRAETGLDGDDDDDDDATPHAKRSRTHADVPGGFTFVDKDGESGRRKIRIEYIGDKSRRHITFSKRKSGIMKKAYELSILTGTQVLLLVVSETGLVYTFTTTKLQPLVQKPEGKNLIQACLNAPEGYGPDGQPLGTPVPAAKTKNGGLAIRPHKLTASASAALAASAQMASQNNEQEDHLNSQQADAAAAVGQGTPVSARPKKRMPSGKGKKAAAAAAAEAAKAEELVPPVPSIPDMHRQSSPLGGPGTMMPGQLTSPISGGYHIPPEYHHQPSPTNPNFGYGGGPGDYPPQGYYGAPSVQGHPHPHAHQYGSHLGVPPPGPHMGYSDGRDSRMMIDSQGRSIGMGM